MCIVENQNNYELAQEARRSELYDSETPTRMTINLISNDNVHKNNNITCHEELEIKRVINNTTPTKFMIWVWLYRDW